MTKRTKLLIIIGSRRKRGNTELLAKVIANRLAASHCVDVELLRLTDFTIEPCKGCLTCIVKRSPCVIEDDTAFVHASMEAADGILFCMPVYEFAPPAVLKLLLDRQYSTVTRTRFHHKRAAVIAVGTMGHQGPLVRAFFDLYLKAMLLQPVGSIVLGEAHGPGSILVDQPAIEAALELAATLVEKLECELPNECPLCALGIVSLDADEVSCPLCGRQGLLVANRVAWAEGGARLSFDSHELARRFGPGAWAASTVSNYRRELVAILEQKHRHDLKDAAFTWVTRRAAQSKPAAGSSATPRSPRMPPEPAGRSNE